MLVVFVAYKIPPARLAEHFAWNDAGYRATGAGVLVVVDAETFRALNCLPSYAAAVEYAVELQPFSLAKTANFGLRRACAAGGVAVKTDVDCYFAPELLAAMALAEPGFGVAPPYHMAESITNALAGRARLWHASRGTIALAAEDWQALCGYNENMAGYGIEDGDLYDRALAAGITFSRAPGLYHIAHAPGIPPPAGFRGEGWNRAGLNPPNHAANRLLRGQPWATQNWGCPPLPLTP